MSYLSLKSEFRCFMFAIPELYISVINTYLKYFPYDFYHVLWFKTYSSTQLTLIMSTFYTYSLCNHQWLQLACMHAILCVNFNFHVFGDTVLLLTDILQPSLEFILLYSSKISGWSRNYERRRRKLLLEAEDAHQGEGARECKLHLL